MTFETALPPEVILGEGLFTSAIADSLGEEALLTVIREASARARRFEVDSLIATAAVSRRSARELGYGGLSQKRGDRTPAALVELVAGVSGADARKRVRIAELVTTASPDVTPWLVSCAQAVRVGRLSMDAAEVIRIGLGEPREGVSISGLSAAADQLVADAAVLKRDQLAAMARRLRDEMDSAGVAEREEERRSNRYLYLTPLPSGMTRINDQLDPESAAILVGAVDAVTAPRRGGPRFRDSDSTPEVRDSRTIPQFMLDALVDIVRVATLADDDAVLGASRVGVRVHVAETDLRAGVGAAHLEGQTASISISTARRMACDAGVVPILMSFSEQPLDVGRSQRLFTTRQRIALAARDGGCMMPGCDKSPSWCEAHHINEWERDRGRTDVADGILLCRHHHMLLHNNGWRIERTGISYWLLSPPGSGMPRRTLLVSKSPLRHVA